MPALEIDRDGTSIWVLTRCFENSCVGRDEAPILKYDASGRLVTSFGVGMFNFPHGFFVDNDGNVWVSDAQGEDGKNPKSNGKGHQVFKFSPEGKVLMTLGKAGVAGEGPDTLNEPTDVVVARNGDIFVSAGHGFKTNARIVKYSKDGKFLKAWGKVGSAPGEFSSAHAIAIDSQGRLFVGDRGNSRIQIFDQDGTIPRPVEAVQPDRRAVYRPPRHPVCVRYAVERENQSRLAARRPDRQREGRRRHRVHSGSEGVDHG